MQIPTLPLTSCVISDRLLNSSEPWFFNLESREIISISQHSENNIRERIASDNEQLIEKYPDVVKDWRQKEKGVAEDGMVR